MFKILELSTVHLWETCNILYTDCNLTVRVYIHKCSHSVLLFPTLQLIFLDPGEESAPLSRGQSFRSTLGWDRYSLFEFASSQLRRTVKQIYSFSSRNLNELLLGSNYIILFYMYSVIDNVEWPCTLKYNIWLYLAKDLPPVP